MTTTLDPGCGRGIALIALSGKPGLHELDLMRHYLDQALERSATLVALDLSQVTSIDASALGAIASSHLRALLSGTALAVVAPSRPALHGLECTHLDRMLAIVDAVPAQWALPS